MTSPTRKTAAERVAAAAAVPHPPIGLHNVRTDDFFAAGRTWRKHFIELGGLQLDDDVLDVGCGTGRMAVPLIEYLTGRYEGFDIAPDAIAWCQENITRVAPNFRFKLVDVGNSVYNPAGGVDAATFVFPYGDTSFDFVFLTSVFTHMLPAGVQNYAREIYRVLRPGGRCLSTWLLLSDDYHQALAEGRAPYELPFRHDVYWTQYEHRPEAVVGYDEAFARRTLEAAGLEIIASSPGRWTRRETRKTGQDAIVAWRPNPDRE